MFELDPVLLARIQFAFTISFHIIFPAFTIGLASFLAVTEWRFIKTGNELFLNIYKFWIKIFSIVFGMGVVSGVVISYQFGTNWSLFSDHTGNVLGPLLAYEVLTAFFLESSFLGIMLFGWGRVSQRMHFAATCIVALGTLLSAFWILSANSWMQTPDGFAIGADGRFVPLNWLKIIFNPSFPYRLFHMIAAAYLSTSFIIGGVSAYYLLIKKHVDESKIMLNMATLMAVCVAPLQLFIGDAHGINTLEHQPLKVAAMEGLWETEKQADLRLFAFIDEKNEKNTHELKIPGLASLILTHKLNGQIKGIKEWPKHERPPVKMVFWSFRIMVGIGLLMIAVGICSGIQYTRKRLHTSIWLQRIWVTMIPSGFIALLAGWFVTEIGRQPYTVYGVLRTAKSVSPAIVAPQVAWSLLAFVIMYTFVFGAGTKYIIKLIKKGITALEDPDQFRSHGIDSSVISSATISPSSSLTHTQSEL